MRIRILIFVLASSFIMTVPAFAGDDSFTLYLVRHAEKQQDGSRDPVLTDIGNQRSAKLASWFSDKNIKDVWSSDYKRTRDTAKPIVSALDLELSLYDPRDLSAFSAKLMANQSSAVVVGHSNTTPELARLLCDCEIADMDDSEHDRLIIISIRDGKAQAKTLQQR